MSAGPINFGAYRLLNLLPEVGVGTTYLARSTTSGEPVVVKIVDPASGGSRDALARMLAKARQACEVRHPNLVAVLAVDCAEGRDFVATEHSAGITLTEFGRLLRDSGRRISARAAATLLNGVALGLAQIHTAGLVHGAVGPQQIVIESDGTARLTGLGVADAENLLALAQHRDMSEVLGYYAPEQVKGGPASAATDQYSLGIVLWELCALKPLFIRDNPGETARLVLQEPISSLADSGCPAPLDKLLMLMLDRDPARRPRSCTQIASALQKILEITGGDAAGEVAKLVQGVAGRLLVERENRLQQALAAKTTPARTAPAAPAVSFSEQTDAAPPELDLDALQPVDDATEQVQPLADSGEDTPPEGNTIQILPLAAPPPGTVEVAPAAPTHAPRPWEFDSQLIERTTGSGPTGSIGSAVVGGDSELPGAEGGGTTFCLSCGAQQDAQAKFCAECGARLGQGAADFVVPNAQWSAEQPGDEESVQLDRTLGGAAIVMEGGQRYVDFGEEVRTGEIELSVDRVGPGSGFRESAYRGRTAELTTLRTALDLMFKRGTLQMRLVSGPDGIGKTRLLGEAESLANEKGFVVAHARGARYGVPIAYDLFRQWVIAICGTLSETPRTTDKLANCTAADALAWPGKVAIPVALQRRLEQLFDGTRHELFHSAIEHRQRLEAALLQLLALIAAATPLCLIADGVHLADPASLKLVRELKTRLPNCRIALFASCAPEVADKFFAPAERIALGPLSDSESVQVAEDFLLHGKLPAELAQALKDGARGNPLLVTHQIRVLMESSILHAEAGEWTLAPVDSGQIMTQAKDFTDERLFFLTPGATHAIRVAALAGEVFSKELIENACTGVDVVARQAIDDTMGCGLAMSLGQSREWQHFRQASSRFHLLQDLEPAAQNELRLTLAKAYQSCNKMPAGEALEIRARHLVAVGPGEQTFQAAAAAARKLMHQGCQELAAEMFGHALKSGIDLLQPGGEAPERLSADLLKLCEQATLCLMADNPLRAASLLVSVQDRLPKDHAPVERGLALRRRALALLAANRPQDAAAAFAQALKTVPPTVDPVTHAVIQAEQSLLLEANNDHERAVGQILGPLKTLGSTSLKGREDGDELFDFVSRLCCRLGRVYHQLKQGELAAKAAQRAREVARRSDLPLREVSALQLQAGLARGAGDNQGAIAYLTEAQAIAEEICDPWLRAQLDFELGRLLPDRGRGTQLLRQAMQLATMSGQAKIAEAARAALEKGSG
ncbi:MAG: protein kinase [Deltaproteobacteria bacterium]|nr:protein kinase [Deltaproteobacteria bacterium]